MSRRAQRRTWKKRDAAAQRFFNLPFLSQAGQSTSAQHHPNTVDHSVIQPPTAWPVYQPPPTKSSPPTQPHHWPPPIQSSPPTKPQHRPVTAWPLYQLPVTQSLPHTHPYYQHPPIQPLHTNTHKNPAALGDQSQASRSKLENSSSSTADTIIIERDPIPDYGEPILRPPESTEDRSWKPCGACKAEVAKLMEEKDNHLHHALQYTGWMNTS
ncbi:hypothetical protein ABVT39_007256 [Epinephelus coioides]